MRALRLLLPLLILSCDGTKDEAHSGDVVDTSDTSALGDDDRDGFGPDEDCDNSDGTVYPGADEICDGEDDDCDGLIDEDAVDAATWYADADGDGYGDDATPVVACDQPDEAVATVGDCDDTDPYVNPDAEEICDELDNDCDGLYDEGGGTWYSDADSDGYGDAATEVFACAQPEGAVADGTDCDDADPEVNPGTSEQCDGLDNDCDGEVDEDISYTWYTDADGDGHGDPASVLDTCDPPAGSSALGDDCDDAVETTHPDADELCNAVDDDCDGTVDDDPVDATTWYEDTDGDGFGDVGTAVSSCEAPGDGYVLDGTDCDDASAEVGGEQAWYEDIDGDGYGDAAASELACEQPEGAVADGTDCDDADAAINPGAAEVCDELDNDCDGGVDDDPSDAATWYADADEDGYGDPDSAVASCDTPEGHVADSADCDDADVAINPDADELCDGLDNDCDGAVDDDATGTASWYADTDGDGYGDAGTTVASCDAPEGYVADATDCDDGVATANPGETEVCDDIDNDCDGVLDEADAADASTWYRDADGDLYGVETDTVRACDRPSGYRPRARDCDDADADVNPSEAEVCDEVDNDCDGSIDESGSDAATWYADADEDGFGDPDTTTSSCDPPEGYVADSADCDDADSAVNPDAIEVCDALDNDCDGVLDEEDAADATTWYYDDDGDGYGDPDSVTVSCDAPTDYVASDDDCDDADSDIHPDAADTCDGVDNDCSGYVDDGGDCACNVEHYEGGTYLFCETERTWMAGASYCSELGYHLLTIDDSAENIWAEDTATGYSDTKWWMGFNDRSTEGTWVWEDGSTVSYTNWHSGEPNDSARNEDCGQLNRFGDYTWNDEPCTEGFPFVCEL